MNDDQIIERALEIIEARLRTPGELISDSRSAVQLFTLKLSTRE